MFSLCSRTLLVLALLTPLCPAPVDRVGIYCMLEQVVVEPTESSAAAPQRIQLWGAFMFADAKGDAYGPATRGYMYFACPTGKTTGCEQEWADLKWYGGSGKGIGFGTRGAALGRLRKETDPLTSPDPYPLEGGIVKMESKEPGFAELVARLKAALGK